MNPFGLTLSMPFMILLVLKWQIVINWPNLKGIEIIFVSRYTCQPNKVKNIALMRKKFAFSKKC